MAKRRKFNKENAMPRDQHNQNAPAVGDGAIRFPETRTPGRLSPSSVNKIREAARETGKQASVSVPIRTTKKS